jgi:hypothetical protein
LVGAAYFIYHKRKSDRILRTMQAQLDAAAGSSRPFGMGTKVELHGNSYQNVVHELHQGPKTPILYELEVPVNRH